MLIDIFAALRCFSSTGTFGGANNYLPTEELSRLLSERQQPKRHAPSAIWKRSGSDLIFTENE